MKLRRILNVLNQRRLRGVAGGILALSLAASSAEAQGLRCQCGQHLSQSACTCEGAPASDYYRQPPLPDGQMPLADDQTLPPPDQSLMIEPGMGNLDSAPSQGPLLASSFGAATGAFAAVPNMMGDIFGTPGGTTIVGRQFVCTGVNQDNVTLLCPIEDRTFAHSNNLSFGQFGIDTNGDGTIDFLPNLVETGGVGGASIDSPQATNGPFFAIARSFQTGSGPDPDINTADIYREVVLYGPSPGNGLILGRTKIAENNSPLPRDRVFVNYSHFNNVPLFPGGVNVNRITPGFEKAFADGQMSLEFRFPFGTTLDNDITADGITATDELLVGNMMIVYKALLASGYNWAVSGGLAVAMPTADDVNVRLTDGTTLLQIRNKSVHFSPFVAYVATPNDRCFFQLFLQGEFDANGNPVAAQGTGGELEIMGRVNDTNYLYFDVGAGFYLYRDRYDRLINSLAPVAELHWNKTLQATDVVRSGGIQIGNFAENVDVLNGVLGLNATLGDATTVTLGYAAPLGAGDNKQFDGEFRLLVNHYFGTY